MRTDVTQGGKDGDVKVNGVVEHSLFNLTKLITHTQIYRFILAYKSGVFSCLQ